MALSSGVHRTGRPGTGRSLSPPSERTSKNEDFQDWEEDGEEDVRGRQIFNFHGTSEDEDVQDGERDGDEDVRGRQFLRLV